jgi:ribosomal protein S18 acetylase RimI-like enzyme
MHRLMGLFFAKAEMLVLNSFSYYRKEGLVRFAKLILEHLGFKRVDRTLLFLALDLNHIVNQVDAYLFSILTQEDVRNDPNYDDGFNTKSKALYRLLKGYNLYVLKQENKNACYAWIEHRAASIWWFDNLPLDLPKDMVYLSDVYTPLEFRNKGFASKMEREIFCSLRKDGYQSAICVITPNNKTSLKMHQKIGFRVYQRVHYKRYWHIRKYVIHKANSSEMKTVISGFYSPKSVWKTYLYAELP